MAKLTEQMLIEYNNTLKNKFYTKRFGGQYSVYRKETGFFAGGGCEMFHTEKSARDRIAEELVVGYCASVLYEGQRVEHFVPFMIENQDSGIIINIDKKNDCVTIELDSGRKIQSYICSCVPVELKEDYLKFKLGINYLLYKYNQPE